MYNPRGAVRQLRDGVDSEAKAADGYPFLVTVTGSLAALNRQHGSNTPMKRYRPNIEIDIGEVDFDENGLLPEDWAQTFEVGGHLLEVASACGRCIVTNLDKGERVGDGLPTIRSRYGVKLDPDGEPLPGSEGKFFGDSANLLVYSKDGTTLSIGNTASITTVSEYPHIQLRQSRK